ncbi:apoptosis regulator BAX-like [Liolophura sinensis]|uniref:apoptosis regulator BAX-like n=1 Tax=Liolophura sinensis TaxID=3198878 RepID=UPI00315956E9
MAAVSATVTDPNVGLPQDDKNSNTSFGTLRTRRRSSHSLSLLTIPEIKMQGSSSCPVYQRSFSFDPEETVEEGCELFQHFVIDQINKEGLKPPEDVFSPTVIRTPDEYKKSVWAETGRELRIMADKFAKTKERQIVRQKANAVSMWGITKEKFLSLLSSLFNEGGVTKERIMVLFFFCSDLAIRSLRQNALNMFKMFLEWSLAYVAEQVCAWVQEHGGWGAVLVDGSIQLFQRVLVGLSILVVSYGFYKLIRKGS